MPSFIGAQPACALYVGCDGVEAYAMPILPKDLKHRESLTFLETDRICAIVGHSLLLIKLATARQ